jgi:Predicted membrane protein (DUF2238)
MSIGGHWTYAEVPVGFWVRDALGLARNHYDRLGHLMQATSRAAGGLELEPLYSVEAAWRRLAPRASLGCGDLQS